MLDHLPSRILWRQEVIIYFYKRFDYKIQGNMFYVQHISENKLQEFMVAKDSMLEMMRWGMDKFMEKDSKKYWHKAHVQ